uniref:RRM domain-containing protein n=1 Tax=Heligmosomoides polygyrus TaxID=6339 RepID=A0A183GVN2_HELPZ
LKIIDNLKILSSQGSLLSCEECAINSAAFFQNMVGPDEVDDELEPEIREEMTKYGQVASVMIHKMDGASDELAVRIFVEFTNVAQAIKAFVVMNGRFFGGRSVAASFYSLDDYNNKEYGR